MRELDSKTLLRIAINICVKVIPIDNFVYKTVTFRIARLENYVATVLKKYFFKQLTPRVTAECFPQRKLKLIAGYQVLLRNRKQVA